MKKISILFLVVIFLSGCTTYKFQKTGSGAKAGYVATYNEEPIDEYTIGKDKTLPQDLDLAKERFNRRKKTVEYYYKKMGLIESRFREVFLQPPAMLVDFIGGVFRWPYTAISDYRYNHNSKYKERMDKLDEQNELLEKARLNALKGKLMEYILQDLEKEAPRETASQVVPAAIPASAEPLKPQAVQQPVPENLPVAAPIATPAPEENIPVSAQLVEKPVIIVPETAKQVIIPVAVITAKPTQGLSPLTVKFSANNSYSKNGKIVSYIWDFGDGDISDKKNTQNTFWSTTYGTRKFVVNLTVKDQAGQVSTASQVIEVVTR